MLKPILINDDTSSDDDDFEDIEYISLEEVEQEEKEFDLEDIFQVQDVILREKLIKTSSFLISNNKSLKVNSTQDRFDVLESPSPSYPRRGYDHSERDEMLAIHLLMLLLLFPSIESFYFDNPSISRPPPEPPDIEKCFEPKAGILIIKEFKVLSSRLGVSIGVGWLLRLQGFVVG
ncbi:hypothetical protein Tco_0754146 [Tanacetum coccineum]